MRVVLVRHAEAVDTAPDELRSLTAAGREAARALGERLRSEGTQVEAVLCSPLLRARETAAALGLGEPEPDERLGPGAGPEALRSTVSGRGETVVVVGHQPDCGLIAAHFSGGVEPPFPPAGVAVLELEP